MPRLSPDTPLTHENAQIVDSRFGRYCEIGAGSRVQSSSFGDYSYCDRLSDIANTTIGKFANVAALTRIGPTDHPITTASQHHFLYRSEYYWDDTTSDPNFFASRTARRTWIGHDTWIGHGAIVKPEIRIGHGAIVAAGAVVTHDVPDWMIVAGCPAKPLRRRFPEGIGARLIRLAWWDWDHDRLRQALPDFRALPVAEFLDRYEL